MKCVLLLLCFIAAGACEGEVAGTSQPANSPASVDSVAESSNPAPATIDSVAASADTAPASVDSELLSSQSHVKENSYGTDYSSQLDRWGRINGNYQDGGYRDGGNGDGGYRDSGYNNGNGYKIDEFKYSDYIDGGDGDGIKTYTGEGPVNGGYDGYRGDEYRDDINRDRDCREGGCRDGGYRDGGNRNGDYRNGGAAIGTYRDGYYDGKKLRMFFISNLIGRQGLGFQKRNYFAAGMRFPITPHILEPIGYRPLLKELYFEPLDKYNYRN